MLWFIIGIVVLIIGITGCIFGKIEQDAMPKIIGIICIIVAIALIGVSVVAPVATGHTGILTTFGKVSPYTLDAGIHLKAPWQKVVSMDNRIQKESVTLSCFSSDIQEVSMMYTVNYQIEASKAMTIYSTIGRNYYNTVIVPCVTESVKIVTAKYTAENIISSRNKMAEEIKEHLTEKLAMYNVILVSTSIENLDFTDEFTNAVEAKQVAQQNKLRAETEAEQVRVEAQAKADAEVIEAQASADALIIEAEAEAEANKMIAESLNDNVLYRMYLEQWDGKLPSVVGADSTIVMPNS